MPCWLALARANYSRRRQYFACPGLLESHQQQVQSRCRQHQNNTPAYGCRRGEPTVATCWGAGLLESYQPVVDPVAESLAKALCVCGSCRGESKQTAAMYRGAGLLESYQRQVQSIDGGLQELEENIDTVREVGAKHKQEECLQSEIRLKLNIEQSQWHQRRAAKAGGK